MADKACHAVGSTTQVGLTQALGLHVKMSHDQQFYWTEPFAFARARARMRPGASNLFLFLGIFVMLAIALAAIDPPSIPSDYGLVALFSGGMALLIAYPGVWLFSRLPNSVLVAADRIAVGRDVIRLTEIQSAIVGTMRIGDSEHRILTFRTKGGREQLYGLGRKVDSAALSKFLMRAGIHEPQA